MKFFEVGGAVRDEFLGRECKDVDFTVEAPSFEAMLAGLQEDGFKVHTITERFLTARARVPEGHPLRERTRDADFVLARKDSAGSDGRRPDFVEPGSIFDDLGRRDFTINAIARDCETGEIIDPFGGREDIANRTLRFVGVPMTRIFEDGLRVMRGLRFMVSLDMFPTDSTKAALVSREAAEMLTKVSIERVQIELSKMFRSDLIEALGVVADLPEWTQDAIFRNGLRLDATLSK